MNAGHPHRRHNYKKPGDLRRLLQEGGAPELMQRWRGVDDRHDMPYLCGYNDAGTLRFIDRDAMRAILDPAFAEEIGVGPIDTGLSPEDTIECLMTHEGVEKVVTDADNPVDTYLPAHEYATLAEHAEVRKRGSTPHKYEGGLKKLIAFCLNKTPQSVPQDLDCAPFLDDPDAREKVLIDIFKSMGVTDAFKLSKCDVDYSESTGEDQCQRCTNWQDDPEQARFGLARCRQVSGLVRTTHWCRKYEPMEKAWVLPEPALKKLLRTARSANNPALWMALGIGIVTIGFAFLDRYVPQLGFTWNILNGKVVGLPYRYLFGIGVALFLFGGYLFVRK